jgi:hypothetical protein
LVDKLGARFDQRFRRNAFVKGFTQPTLKDLNVRFDIRSRQLTLRPHSRIVRLIGQSGECRVGILFG